MRNLMMAGAAALAFATAPAVAQDAVAVDAEGNVYVLTDEQQVMYDAWPPDRRTMYDAWPMEVQQYYWTLTPVQVEGWWVLTDDQRVRLYEMTPAQRAAAWTQISTQMSTSTSARTPATTTRASTSANIRFVSNATVQPIPNDSPPVGELPICEPDQEDDCINQWEATGTGTRPLGYWPGRPASEIDEPLPAEDPND